MRIIPSIDIINSRCVRLVEGDYNELKEYEFSVLDIAESYARKGFNYLHIVDLDAARTRRMVNLELVKEIAGSLGLEIDYGGGVRNLEDIEVLLDAGVSKVNVGSMAVRNPEMLEMAINKFGPERIILSADCRNELIAIDAWQNETSISIYDFLEAWQSKSLKYVCITDISKDGRLEGPNVQLYDKLCRKFELNIIASGGVTSIDNVKALASTGCDGAIIGKALLEDRIDYRELLTYA